MKPVIRNLMCLLSAVAVMNGEVEKQKCVARKYDENSVVCVCSSKYCDNTGTISPPEPGKCLHFVSNMAGLRLDLQPCTISKGKGNGGTNITKITVDPSQKYQTVLGFGGAITDSVGINIGSLTPQTQKALLSEYFGPDGIGYSFIRLPMGGSDFSTRYYTYDDVDNDTTLSHFNLTYEDHMYKIPFVKLAIELSPRPVKLITSMWQVPTWMKEPRVGEFLALAKVNKDYYQILADYMIRYLNSYKSEGLEFWTVSPQNEPLSAFFFYWIPSALTWTPQEQAQFFTTNLIPTLNSNGYENLNLTLLDDARPWANPLLNEFKNHPEIMERAACLGVHWYLDKLFSPYIHLDVKSQFPNLTIISTEASIIRLPGMSAVRLGFWGNAERYITDIITDMNVEVAAWIDWNIALDLNGGPSYLSNYLDSAIIVNASADEFYKQPIFYALAHFSKFVPPGSVRINLKLNNQPLFWIDLRQWFKAVQGTAFLTPDNTIVVVLSNRNKGAVNVELDIEEIGTAHITLTPHSISTVIFSNDV